MEGVILAGGEGSRMRAWMDEIGLPSKHLCPIGNETPVTRMARQFFQAGCESVSCVVPLGKVEYFEREFEKKELSVNILERTSKKRSFVETYQILVERLSSKNLVLSMGDLTFTDEAVSAFIKKAKAREQSLIGLCRNQLKEFDLRISMVSLTPEFLIELLDNKINPDEAVKTILYGFRMFFRGDLSMTLTETIGNLNDPASYSAAKSRLK